jgi:hypothetical protein
MICTSHAKSAEPQSQANVETGKATTAFVCDKMPWEKEWTIRIVVPGIDGGSAVWLETTCVRMDRAGAEALLDSLLAGLTTIQRQAPSVVSGTEKQSEEDL